MEAIGRVYLPTGFQVQPPEIELKIGLQCNGMNWCNGSDNKRETSSVSALNSIRMRFLRICLNIQNTEYPPKLIPIIRAFTVARSGL